MRRISHQTKSQKGFTLIEMLVVAPLMVLVVATLIGFMISLVGSVTVSNARAQAQYDTQDALDQIEQDAFFSTGFLSSYTPNSPQDKSDGTQSPAVAFQSSSNDIIINQPATDKNPTDPTRQIVYFANTPNACTGQIQVNSPLYVKAIYYLKTVNGVQSLYRRTVVSPNNVNGTLTTCATPWQRNSCVSTNYNSNAICVSKDERLVDYVAPNGLSVTYYNKADPGTTLTDPTQADSIKVSITVQKSVSGDNITTTMGLAASRANITSLIPLGQ